jgi:hypothetical protein
LQKLEGEPTTEVEKDEERASDNRRRRIQISPEVKGAARESAVGNNSGWNQTILLKHFLLQGPILGCLSA